MHRNKRIAIILADTLQRLGLQSLLIDYFSPVEVSCFSSFELFANTGSDSYDYYFTDSDSWILNSEFFLPHRSKTLVLMSRTRPAELSNNHITTCSPQEVIIEEMERLLTSASLSAPTTEKNKGLSAREIDVLQLIVKGITNKEIADKLNISLNTVLTHRKNITAKLGIKTVSGLTFYALMNGIVSTDNIDL